jgi:hypothetical protein
MASTSDFGETLVPKDTLPITVSKSTIYVCPDITLSMSKTEKSYGFMVKPNRPSKPLISIYEDQAAGTTPRKEEKRREEAKRVSESSVCSD